MIAELIIIVFVRKFLPFLLLLALSLSAQDDTLNRFLKLYYSGDYLKAHELIRQIYPGTWKQQVWDDRLHAQEQIENCEIRRQTNSAAEGLAQLHIGDFDSASECFSDDWLSLLALATYSNWQNHRSECHDYIRKALALSPDNPDLLYFAACVAPNREMTFDFFNRFLELSHDDAYRQAVAEYSVAFLKKTWDIPLNEPVEFTGFEKVDSNYDAKQLLIHALINGSEKVSLLLDTGAGGITLKEKDWRPQLTTDVMMLGLGKKQRSPGLRLVLNQFQAGRFELKNPIASMTPAALPPGADGVAGTGLFAEHYMLVPLRSGQAFTLFTCDEQDPMACLQSKGIRFSQQTSVPFYSVNGLLIAKGRVRNSPQNLDMMIDTGAARSVISSAAAKRYGKINYQLSHDMREQSGVSGVGGKADDVLVAENIEVEIAGIKKQFNAMPAMNLGDTSEAMELELDMILGRDFLEGYTLLLDYHNNRITFLK